jgi:predicted nucleic acid-binding protein
MAARLLFDTDVLIDYLRDVPLAMEFLRQADTVLVSAVSVGELFAGVREGEERIRLDALLQEVDIVPLDRQAAEHGGLFQRQFGRSHNVGLPDALIAASSELHGARLVTLNRKHFPMLPDVLVPYRKGTGS